MKEKRETKKYKGGKRESEERWGGRAEGCRRGAGVNLEVQVGVRGCTTGAPRRRRVPRRQSKAAVRVPVLQRLVHRP